jgi:signal transduction histidine kinase
MGKRQRAAPLFMGSIVTLVAAGLGLSLFRDPRSFSVPELVFWVAVIATVELLPVPVSREIHLSLGFPLLLAVGMLYPPHVAALVALIGSFDPRELRGEIGPTKALYNRSQVALSTLAGSATFHWLGSVDSNLGILLPASLAAIAANFCVNVALVSLAVRLLYASPFSQILRQLLLGEAVPKHLLNYLGLGFFGVVITRLHSDVGLISVAAFILPMIFARQMFFRNVALQEAHKNLKERGQVLRALSNRMAEERQDERMRIAAYLHDDLAQMLFRLNLQAEMAKKRLTQGDYDAVIRDIEGILDSKQETSNAIRALIRDLHRSPIGRKGLAEALQSFADDMSKGTTRVVTDVVEVSLPPPIQLLIYQISREATMNALKHAEADEISISLAEIEDGVALTIHDDGKGFDTDQEQPEGHFGSVMMRERALVAGGTYSLTSEVGKGTTITATFPRVWVEEGSELEATGTDTEDDSGRPPVGTSTGPRSMNPYPDSGGNGRAASQAEAELEPEEPEEARPVPA